MRRIEEAREAMDRARGAMADVYGSNLYARATAMLASASRNRQRASYDQAIAQSDLAVKLAGEAIDEANRTAPVQDNATVVALFGPVEISPSEGDPWRPAEAGESLPVGSRIRTGDGARTDLQLADGSAFQLQSSSEFFLEDQTRDRRDQKRATRLKLLIGELVGDIIPRENTNSQLHIHSAGSVTAIRGTKVLLGADEARSVKLSVLTGEADLAAAGQEQKIPAMFGSLVRDNKPPLAPIKLPPAPEPRSPVIGGTTAVQRTVFDWAPAEPARDVSGYRIEIAEDESFTRIIQDRMVEQLPWAADPLAPGRYFWRVSSLNLSRLQGPPAPSRDITVRRDLRIAVTPSKPPVKHSGRLVVGPGHTFSWATPSPDTSAVLAEYSLDGETFMPLSAPLRFDTEGPQVLRVRGVGADEERGALREVKLYVDATPPEIGISISPTRAQASGVGIFTVTLTAQDETGVDRIEYSINQKAFQPYASPLELGNYEDYHLRFRAIDDVANESETRSLMFPAGHVPRGGKGTGPGS
jgi:hypothetical protein